MNQKDASKQIKNMVNFIIQEAHEKAEEVRVQVAKCGCFPLSVYSTQARSGGAQEPEHHV